MLADRLRGMGLGEFTALIVAFASTLSGARMLGYFHATDFRLIGLIGPQDILIQAIWSAPLVAIPPLLGLMMRYADDEVERKTEQSTETISNILLPRIFFRFSLFIVAVSFAGFLFSGRYDSLMPGRFARSLLHWLHPLEIHKSWIFFCVMAGDGIFGIDTDRFPLRRGRWSVSVAR